MYDCICCGATTSNYDYCDPCRQAILDDVDCPPESTWHCFTGHCDGSGCTYEGECEGK